MRKQFNNSQASSLDSEDTARDIQLD